MNEELGSFKSLEDVRLKATYDIEIGNRVFNEGETVAVFDKIDIAGLEELRTYVAAHGGFDNRNLVYWDATKELRVNFSQGVFSNTQFALLNNSKLIIIDDGEPVLISTTDVVESNSEGLITTTYQVEDEIFVYDKSTGEKLQWEFEDNKIKINDSYKDVVVNYRYNYIGKGTTARIGQRLLSGYLSLEGKTRVKDDTSGLITTGIIRIPKLKLMSGLSIRLGSKANPVVANFSAVGVPVGSRNNSYVAEFIFLENDIDSDM